LLVVNFLKQITLNNVLASTVKRFGLYAAEYGLMNLIVPPWISPPLRFTVMTTVGTASKSMAHWIITPNTKSNYLDEPLIFIGKEDELNQLEFVVINDSPTGYQFSFKTLPTQAKKMTTSAINATGNYIINTTMEDIMGGIGATIGSTAATGAFVIVLGPPSLLSLPAYYLLEGPTRSFGAFCGRQFSNHILGSNAVKPALQSAFSAKKINTKGEEIETTVDDLLETFEILTISSNESTDEIIDSFEILETPPTPIILKKTTEPITIIEDYLPTSTLSYSSH